MKNTHDSYSGKSMSAGQIKKPSGQHSTVIGKPKVAPGSVPGWKKLSGGARRPGTK